MMQAVMDTLIISIRIPMSFLWSVVANLLNFNIVVSRFEHQSWDYVHFRTNILISQSMD